MHIAILGRQPELSLVELQQVTGQAKLISAQVAAFEAAVDINRLGGSQKIATLIKEFPTTSWPKIEKQLHDHYVQRLSGSQHKVTLGLSAYDWPSIQPRDLQKLGLKIKNSLKKQSVSLRLLPSSSPALSTASTFHNRLGSAEHKIEIILTRLSNGGVILAETKQVQNINAYAARDQKRPKRDAFVGMLPPKLAQMMINMAAGKMLVASQAATLLDPFCGTGVILQEALLMGYDVYGTDLADKMIDYSRENLHWLQATHQTTGKFRLQAGDATSVKWQPPLDVVACETYLGQPFSAPPSPAKLREVVGTCNRIISSFLLNLHPQLQPGTSLCIAVPAWQSRDGSFTHLPLTNNLAKLGYQLQPVTQDKLLLYYRPDQVVARQLLVLKTT